MVLVGGGILVYLFMNNEQVDQNNPGTTPGPLPEPPVIPKQVYCPTQKATSPLGYLHWRYDSSIESCRQAAKEEDGSFRFLTREDNILGWNNVTTVPEMQFVRGDDPANPLFRGDEPTLQGCTIPADRQGYRKELTDKDSCSWTYFCEDPEVCSLITNQPIEPEPVGTCTITPPQHLLDAGIQPITEQNRTEGYCYGAAAIGGFSVSWNPN